MIRWAVLLIALALALACSVAFGETSFSAAQYAAALRPGSPEAEVLWSLRLPRGATAAAVGAALGLAGAAMQGLLRNPLADPGVLGVSAFSGLGASLAIVAGLGGLVGVVEAGAMAGALFCAAVLAFVAARLREPEALILFGVALSAFAGAATSLVFNLSPSPITTTEVLAWLLGSVENRSWRDLLWFAAPAAAGVGLCLYAGRGLRALTLGEETAALSGLPMTRMRTAAVVGAALLAGASVAIAGVIGFVGLAAPHMVRAFWSRDPERILWPSALAGGLLLVTADLLGRLTPTEQPLRLGVVTALVGAPIFAVIAWRAARGWRG